MQGRGDFHEQQKGHSLIVHRWLLSTVIGRFCPQAGDGKRSVKSESHKIHVVSEKLDENKSRRVS